MITSPKQNFVQGLLSAKKNAETKLQGIGKRIGNNIRQGNADFNSGKNPYYAAVNPFK